MKGNYKKFIFLFLLFSISIGVFLPFHYAHALPILGDIAKDIANLIANFVIEIIGHLLDMAYGVLDWIISPDFLGMTMTGPDNHLVYHGWSYVRDLADIFLVLGLIVIALGIILGIKEYEAKRTLPILIAIALLINFTPVICGWIIDFSNYLMKWLLKGGFDNGFVNAIQQGLANQGGKEALDAIITSLVFIIFGIVAIVVIGLYCLLFLMRYVFLWILIIFSPIAFVSRVFGPNRYIKMFFPGFLYWDNWWQSFIQWCIIGVFGAFFIFLANKSMVDWAVSPSGPPSFLASLYIYIFPIFLLLIGFFATISAASEGMKVVPGAKQAMGVMQKAAVKGGKWAGRKAGEKMPAGLRRFGERMARWKPPVPSKEWGKEDIKAKKWRTRAKGWMKRGAATALNPKEWGKEDIKAEKRRTRAKGWMKRGAGWVGSAVGRTTSIPITAAGQGIGKAISKPAAVEKEEARKVAQSLEGAPTQEMLKKMRDPLALPGDKVGSLKKMIDEHKLDDAKAKITSDKESPKEKKKALKEFDEDIKETAKIAASTLGDRESFMEIVRANPHMADEIITGLDSETRKEMEIREPSTDELRKEYANPEKVRSLIKDAEAEREKGNEDEADKLRKEAQSMMKNGEKPDKIIELLNKADNERKNGYTGIAKRLQAEAQSMMKNGEALNEIDNLRKSGKWRKADKKMNEFLRENEYDKFGEQVIKGTKEEDVGKIAGEALGIRKPPWLQQGPGETKEEFEKRKESPEYQAEEIKYLKRVERVLNAIHKHWMPDQITAAIRTFKKPFADKYMEGAKKRGIIWYIVNNPTMATYMTSMFAPQSGLFAPEDVTLRQKNTWQDKLNRLKEDVRNAFGEQLNLLKEEQRNTLTEALKKNPNRLSNEELEGKRLEEKIKKWMEEDKK